MKNLLIHNKVVPKWIVLLIDQFIISWSFAVSFFVVRKFEFSDVLRGHFLVYLGLYCTVSLSVFYLMRIHTGVIRYSNSHDFLRIFSAVLNCTILYWVLISFPVDDLFNITLSEVNSALFINFFVSSTLLILMRVGVKGFFRAVKNSSSGPRDIVLIYGSDRTSILIKNAVESSTALFVAGFIDSDYSKVDKYIEQKRVYHPKDILYLKNTYNVTKLLVVTDMLKTESEKAIVETCIELGIRVCTVPPSDEWVYGKLNMKQLQALKIEDLLQREPIVIQTTNILSQLSGKRILITGAAGSIGSEIVRQVMTYYPEMVILCDQAESPLHELQLEIEENFPGVASKIYISNIQNYSRMEALFNDYRPDIVFHAAAYKHVPMMENNPTEAVLTNVLGTKNIADLAIAYNVDKFIMISTDKAVNPTNVMGASKRIAEIYIQALSNRTASGTQIDAKTASMKGVKTKFITTRFGNVLGSNGSVIPRFRAQIDKGGPVTVTHPDITRYFMTIPEAVQLVLEAGAMGNGGEIFIFDMGKPVKIVDLAYKMIKLAGLIPDQDIKVVFTGLRPGEKLYEELLQQEEHDIPTHHEKIRISKVRTYPYAEVVQNITELIALNQENNELEVVRKMKAIVPEYKSKNSRYEDIDVMLKLA